MRKSKVRLDNIMTYVNEKLKNSNFKDMFNKEVKKLKKRVAKHHNPDPVKYLVKGKKTKTK